LNKQTGQSSFIAVNGRILPEEEARISPLDRGFLYGDGLFETIKACSNRVDFLEHHLKRLREGASSLYIPFPEQVDFQALILQLLHKNGIQGEIAIKICLSRGVHTGPISLYQPASPTCVIFVRPYTGADQATWNRGMSLAVEREMFSNASSNLCRLKSMNYLFYLMARTRAQEKGFEEAILLNTSSNVCECTAANLFFFRNGRLQTPDVASGLLPGVLREALLRCLAEAGEPVEEVKLPAEALDECEEIFATNALMEVMPVGRVDDRSYPNREKTLHVLKLFRSYRDSVHGNGACK